MSNSPVSNNDRSEGDSDDFEKLESPPTTNKLLNLGEPEMEVKETTQTSSPQSDLVDLLSSGDTFGQTDLEYFEQLEKSCEAAPSFGSEENPKRTPSPEELPLRDASPVPIDQTSPPSTVLSAPSEEEEFASKDILQDLDNSVEKVDENYGSKEENELLHFEEASHDSGNEEEINSVAEEPLLDLPETSQSVVEEPPVVAKMESSQSTAVSSSCEGSCCPFVSNLWLHPEKVHPCVAELTYWKDPKKSGAVFGVFLVILLSLTYFSSIMVFAYSSLTLLAVTMSYRIYMNVLQAVQKSGEGHPLKQYLEMEVSIPNERVQQFSEHAAKTLNHLISKLRSLFLVEDIIDSLKFGMILWCLTYVGSWFNGLTLVILGYIAMFTFPKVYETHKTQIDHYYNLASTQICDTIAKIKAKIPIGKKEKEQ